MKFTWFQNDVVAHVPGLVDGIERNGRGAERGRKGEGEADPATRRTRTGRDTTRAVAVPER